MIFMVLSMCATWATACEFDDDSTSLSVAVDLGGPELTLEASRDYGPPTKWQDAEVELEQPISFALPRQIPVLFGNSGNHWTVLSFRDQTGLIVECDYRGGSKEPHPESERELALAGAYVFERCSNGAAAGSMVTTSWVKLHVQLGDQKDPAGRTTVQLRLGESFPALAPPISAADSIAIRDAFSWQSTQPLPETNAEGFPALYYAIIYLEDQEQRDALYELMIHHDELPMFADELSRWEGQRGTFEHQGDGTGIFVFALIPAVTYNLLRDAALEGNEIFRVIQLREIPEAMRGADGSISYAALRSAGFLYLDGEPLPPEDPGEEADDFQTSLFNSIKRRIVRAIAGVVRAVVVGIQQGIGFVDRIGRGSVDLTVVLDMRNTDPAFGGRLAQGTSTPMQRTWGVRSGAQVTLPDVRVTLRQTVLGGALPTKFLERTNDDGTATIAVARERRTAVCLDVKNRAAEVTQAILPMQICDFDTIAAADLRQDLTQRFRIQNGYFNILAQANEGYEFMRDVVGFTPRKAIILVGGLANLFNPMRAALAPCFGFLNGAYDIAAEMVASLLGFTGGLVRAGAIIYAVDIIIANDPDGAFDANLDSRGIPSHEYGHFALASLLRDQGLGNITVAYTDAIISRITEVDANNLPPADHEAAYINEGFADFIAEQIAGGRNYVRLGTFRTADHDNSLDMQYCYANVGGCACIDRNGANTDTFRAQVARFVSLLHDAFDGWPRAGQTPGGWNVWRRNVLPVAYDDDTSHVGDARDEQVTLAGNQIRRLMQRWDARGNTLRERHFLGGLADVVRESGYSWCQMCQMFALHDQRLLAGGPVPADLFTLCTSNPIASWIGAPPAGTTTCTLGCDDGNPCTIDTVQVNGGCLACTHAMANAGTMCRPAAGPCDTQEVCTGASAACPADSMRPFGYECRSAVGACDQTEVCTGASAECPGDALRPSGHECRAAAGPCDVAETCTGISSICPGDALQPSGHTCRPAAGTCDVVEVCTGTSTDCPGDQILPAGTTCRASTNSCDPAEVCTGSAGVCPEDRNMCVACNGSPVSQVPAMTSPTTPSGIVTRSGAYDSSEEAWEAFDASNATMWISEVWQDPAWIAYEWTDGPRTITRYAIHFVNGSSLTSRAPRDWTLQGWNGSSWVVVDTRTNQINWGGSETRTYDVGSAGSYSKYRLHITEDNDSRAAIVAVSMGRLDLMGCR